MKGTVFRYIGVVAAVVTVILRVRQIPAWGWGWAFGYLEAILTGVLAGMFVWGLVSKKRLVAKGAYRGYLVVVVGFCAWFTLGILTDTAWGNMPYGHFEWLVLACGSRVISLLLWRVGLQGTILTLNAQSDVPNNDINEKVSVR
jgi:hypothetical protein